MTDKEFKRLSRAQLIDIIYQFQLKVDELNNKIQEMETALADKRFRIDSAGNIAEAALEINDCFVSAQNAVDQYMDEIKIIRAEAEAERQQILAAARAEANEIVANAKKGKTSLNLRWKQFWKNTGRVIRIMGDCYVT